MGTSPELSVHRTTNSRCTYTTGINHDQWHLALTRRDVHGVHGQQHRRMVTRIGETQHRNDLVRGVLRQSLVGHTDHRRRRLGVDHVEKVSGAASSFVWS